MGLAFPDIFRTIYFLIKKGANVSQILTRWTPFVTVPGVWIAMNEGRALRKLEPGETIPDGATLDSNAWDHEHWSLWPGYLHSLWDTEGEEGVCPNPGGRDTIDVASGE